MKRLCLFLTLAVFAACKKDDPKPEPPKPTPITEANTTFNIKSQAFLKLMVGSDIEIRNYTGANQPKQDTSITKTIKSQNITFSITGQISPTIPVTLTINSGHKSYTFVDSTNKGSRTVALW